MRRPATLKHEGYYSRFGASGVEKPYGLLLIALPIAYFLISL